MTRRPIYRAIIAGAALAAFGCSAQTAGEPVYRLDECRKVLLFDAATRLSIVGAEDIAFDAAGDRLIVSAYDRRRVEAAAKTRAEPPTGGLYAVPRASLRRGPSATATPLARPDAVPGGLRPHGVDFNSLTGEIAFVNRGYVSKGTGSRRAPAVMSLDRGGRMHSLLSADITHCAANDVLAGAEIIVSFDHGKCGGRGFLEDVFGLGRAGLMLNGDVALDGVRFANGLARLPDGGIALAETRARAIRLVDVNGAQIIQRRTLRTPGGPDNLSIAQNGDVVAAVHPSPLRIGLHRKLGIGAAPSRIVRIDPESGAVTTLFDDRAPALFAAATAAVEIDDALYAGSVLDEGLLVCQRGEDTAS